MENDVIITEKIIMEDLFYHNDSIMNITIKYPSFRSEEYPLFTKYLNYYYYNKMVVNEMYHINELYELAKEQYDYSMENQYPILPYELYIDYRITYNDNCTISLYYEIYTFTGGAHGNTDRKSDTWNLNSRREMNLYDYFVDPANYKDIIIEEIDKQIGETATDDFFMYFENYKELVEETFQKDNYYLTKEGIVIYFQQYDIAPYSSGIPTFLIPYSNENIIPPSC